MPYSSEKASRKQVRRPCFEMCAILSLEESIPWFFGMSVGWDEISLSTSSLTNRPIPLLERLRRYRYSNNSIGSLARSYIVCLHGSFVCSCSGNPSKLPGRCGEPTGLTTAVFRLSWKPFRWELVVVQGGIKKLAVGSCKRKHKLAAALGSQQRLSVGVH
jgi:hypothetical protein